jgi:hypothetical protein
MGRLVQIIPFAAFLLIAAQSARAGEISVSFDIKPTSCPNAFNPPDLFFIETLPTAILGTDEFNAGNIQPSGLVLVVPGGGGLLGGDVEIPPTHTGFEDVTTPVIDPEFCECTEDGPDGFIDFTAHFDGDEVAAALGDVSSGDQIPICIRGFLKDGTPFEGCDCILIVGPVSVDAETWGRTKARYR